jgi:hypothetical protein
LGRADQPKGALSAGANRSENVAGLPSRDATRAPEIRLWNPTKANASKQAPNIRPRIYASISGVDQFKEWEGFVSGRFRAAPKTVSLKAL